MVVELNRRLVKGYAHFKDDPRIVHLKKSIADYNRELRLLGIRDHQVEYARFSFFRVIGTLIGRLLQLVFLTIGTLPGLLLFTPVFIITKVISIKKSKEALAASTVKLQGRDVMATWKLLVALAFAPTLYAFYTAAFTYWAYRNRIQGLLPSSMPLWLIVPIGMALFPAITFAALRIGEIGMDIIKSLPPLVLSLNPSSANSLVRLRHQRAALAQHVTEVINTLGPELFPDFDAARVVSDPFRERDRSTKQEGDAAAVPEIKRTRPSEHEEDTTTKEPLPRNESFHNLANIGFFSTRPPSRSRSRSYSHSRSSSFGGRPGSSGQQLKPMSQINSTGEFDQVSAKIRDAMRERGARRRRQSEDSNSRGAISSDPGTPSSEEGRKDL